MSVTEPKIFQTKLKVSKNSDRNSNRPTDQPNFLAFYQDLDLLTCNICQDGMALVVPFHGLLTIHTFTLQWVSMIMKVIFGSATKVFVVQIKDFWCKFSPCFWVWGKPKLCMEDFQNFAGTSFSNVFSSTGLGLLLISWSWCPGNWMYKFI